MLLALLPHADATSCQRIARPATLADGEPYGGLTRLTPGDLLADDEIYGLWSGSSMRAFFTGDGPDVIAPAWERPPELVVRAERTRGAWVARTPAAVWDDTTPPERMAFAVWLGVEPAPIHPPDRVALLEHGQLRFGASDCEHTWLELGDVPLVLTVRPVDYAGNEGPSATVVVVPR
jgi:hypothetical protein